MIGVKFFKTIDCRDRVHVDKLPERCEDCPCNERDGYCVFARRSTWNLKGGKLADCPLVDDVAPVAYGGWITAYEDRVKCSHCDEGGIPEKDSYYFNYCPYCGAKMIDGGGRDETD